MPKLNSTLFYHICLLCPHHLKISPYALTRLLKLQVETKSEFQESQESLYTVAASVVRSADKTELSYRNKMIIVFLFAANKSKDNA